MNASSGGITQPQGSPLILFTEWLVKQHHCKTFWHSRGGGGVGGSMPNLNACFDSVLCECEHSRRRSTYPGAPLPTSDGCIELTGVDVVWFMLLSVCTARAWGGTLTQRTRSPTHSQPHLRPTLMVMCSPHNILCKKRSGFHAPKMHPVFPPAQTSAR